MRLATPKKSAKGESGKITSGKSEDWRSKLDKIRVACSNRIQLQWKNDSGAQQS
jgi:hypothetical protein